MKQEEIISYVYDFLRVLYDAHGGSIRQVILFGSVARGDFRETSDVDLFIDAKPDADMKSLRKGVDNAVYLFEQAATKTWRPRGVNLRIKPIVDKLDAPRWKALKSDIISYGIMLFGKYRELPEKLRHLSMLSFDMRSLKPKDKVKVLRNVYGYKTKKAGRVYQQEGMVNRLGGYKLGENIILVPIERSRDASSFFTKAKIPLQIRECFMRS